MKLSRRELILGSLAAASLGLIGKHISLPENLPSLNTAKIPGKIAGANSSLGHMLRGGDNFPDVTNFIETEIAIVGGGIAGLSAAWKLSKAGVKPLMLEMENNIGGNSQYGENKVSSYPWGAHYLPLPTEESNHVIELLEEIGVITGYENGTPVYNEYYLCAEPDERLFIYGQWQEGLLPTIGATESDKEQYKKFFEMMENFKTSKGADGKPAFAIPVDKSSRDKQFLQYDKITMAAFMEQNGFVSKHLHWYVNYACRDDYGATIDDVSAWAGIHYFAARASKVSNSSSDNVLTWPEGNGWLVKKLKSIINAEIYSNALVYKVSKKAGHVLVEYYDAVSRTTTQIKAKSVIMATPHFITSRLTGMPVSKELTYAPWMVANITLNKMPQGEGNQLSWDNVIYDSEMLGYVVATHQNLTSRPLETVITYYWPLSHLSPIEARKQAYERKYEEWQDIVLAELYKIHPELKNHVTNMDVWLWGHGMIRPVPGYIWGETRQNLSVSDEPIFHAHSDMSGISIFEEAQYRGVIAAESAIAYLNKRWAV